MAEIFLARAKAIHDFEKLVVLKRILPQHAASEDFISMFLTEARLAATLHHPNIVQVYDIGEDRGAVFFTMEYVQGQDLRGLVRAARKQRRPIPLEHILHVVIGLAAGLHHAHEMVGLDGKPLGIVHRDVSPSNVLVTYEGDVKIVDFGIAKATTAQVATIAGTLKGKIPYMSPEQCRGEMVDRRSDIFSIGTLLWELTTGRRLFSGDNDFAVLNRVARGDVPSPSSVRPEYPPQLEKIVMRALQAKPGDRYESTIEFQIALEDFAREHRLPVSSTRMGRFMRDLFKEDIEQAKSDLAEPSRAERGPIVAVLDGGASRSEGSSLSQVGVYEEPTRGHGTSATVADYPSTRSRRGPLLVAIGALAVAVAGVAGTYLYLEGPPPLGQTQATPLREGPASQAAGAVELQPLDIASAGTAVAAPPASEPSAEAAEPAEPASRPAPRKRSKPAPAPARSRSRPKKKQYDLDDALPPGVGG